MMSAPPPPRYRIVERGRRLEVIDTWRAESAPPPDRPVLPAMDVVSSSSTPPRPPGRMRAAWPTAIVAWFVLSAIFWPLIFAPLALIDPRVRRNFRAAMRWIDDAVDTGERR